VVAVGGIDDAGFVFRSPNGGKTWHRRYISDTALEDIVCPSQMRCYGTGDYSGEYGVSGGSIDTTSNGGEHWRRLWKDPISDKPARGIAGISCTSITVCIAVGSVVDQDGWTKTRRVLTTVDGGAHWSNHKRGAGMLSDISCPSVQVCYAVGIIPGHTASSLRGLVLRTDDAGGTWRSLG
jgi:photosystem II stability/assembly factor-like uncharacterized protein